MRFSLQTLFILVFLVSLYFGLLSNWRLLPKSQIYPVPCIPEIMAIVTACVVTARGSSLRATILAAAGCAGLAALALGIEVGESLRRGANYFSWLRIGDVMIVVKAIVYYLLRGAIIGTICGLIFRQIRRALGYHNV